MEKRERGIVIKTFYPHKQKVSVITQAMGKINLVCPSSLVEKIRPGMSLACNPEILNETTYHSGAVEIIHSPVFSSQQDFYCFHHLAELSYYAVPLANPCDEIFAMLDQALRRLEMGVFAGQEQTFFHELTIARFLVLIGFYPNQHELSSLFVDFAKSDTLHCLRACMQNGNDQQEALNLWIMQCLHSHPCCKLFKTLSFMYTQEPTFSSFKEKP